MPGTCPAWRGFFFFRVRFADLPGLSLRPVESSPLRTAQRSGLRSSGIFTKGMIMPKISPWHSIKSPVHHDNTDCNTGNNIEKENLRQGTGGKPLCDECKRLDGGK